MAREGVSSFGIDMNQTTKGQISLWIALVGAGGMITAAGVTGWFSAANAISSRVGAMETKIGIVETTENLHYLEVSKILGRMESKLDGIQARMVK